MMPAGRIVSLGFLIVPRCPGSSPRTNGLLSSSTTFLTFLFLLLLLLPSLPSLPSFSNPDLGFSQTRRPWKEMIRINSINFLSNVNVSLRRIGTIFCQRNWSHK
ncbi:hypothetical protein SLEP1_g49775 [Rubroshorea leprosula]|uniref:Uncharacterized protein n=1 Tax=Rubroshorea leprosula TaxID=152421 RepID=A0AAV5LXW3_9ROSI|nr:hypothetical protein SLEP1_g49775 [Rubroshorea leprosula]